MGQPHFLCIGAQKAGTTWLYSMLSQNPGVFLPPVKEIHFFDFLHVPENRWWIRKMFNRTAERIVRERPADQPYFRRLATLPRRSDAWYQAIFDHPDAVGRLAGEITPAYSFLPSKGVAKVAEVNPAMRIILVVRDPVDRALSQLRMLAERNKWSTIDAMVLEDPRISAEIIQRSAYRENIRRWEAVFPPEQLLYLPYPRIANDPEGFLGEVEAFIGAPPHKYRAATESVHSSRRATIAPEVTAGLERLFVEERAWLAGRFGNGF